MLHKVVIMTYSDDAVNHNEFEVKSLKKNGSLLCFIEIPLITSINLVMSKGLGCWGNAKCNRYHIVQ